MDQINFGTLRRVLENDLELLLEWRNDDRIRKFMFDQKPITLEEHVRWFEKVNTDLSRDLLIFENDINPLGFVQIVYSMENALAEWGFYAAPTAPKGVGERMLSKVLDHIFDIKGSSKVFGQVLGYNAASIRLHQKLGFMLEGVLRQHHCADSITHDIHQFGMLSSERHRLSTLES
jgi:UDP-4-amino-4,6-dideoxy-N-acetyl-beta-L-altrosamine N-acetyltransferase